MKPITVLIVDDEEHAIRRVERLVAANPHFVIVGTCYTGQEAYDRLCRSSVDLMFLDIEMPGMSGIQLMEKLSGGTLPAVIFVTAYDEFAVMAFEYFALDYILKPFSNERFEKTLLRAKAYIQGQPQHIISWNQVTESFVKKTLPQEKIMVKTGRNYEFIGFEEISYISANGVYSNLILKDGRTRLHRDTIHHLADLLQSQGFVRIHHSAIVNPAEIKGIQRLNFGNSELIMKDGTHLRISRKYKKAIHKLLF